MIANGHILHNAQQHGTLPNGEFELDFRCAPCNRNRKEKERMNEHNDSNNTNNNIIVIFVVQVRQQERKRSPLNNGAREWNVQSHFDYWFRVGECTFLGYLCKFNTQWVESSTAK